MIKISICCDLCGKEIPSQIQDYFIGERYIGSVERSQVGHSCELSVPSWISLCSDCAKDIDIALLKLRKKAMEAKK